MSKRTTWFMLAVSLLLSVNGCMSDSPIDRTGPTAYDQRDRYGRPTQPRQPTPWDMRQNQQQLGPSTWYGCPQQSPGCFPE